jgi:hypothetical protein
MGVLQATEDLGYHSAIQNIDQPAFGEEQLSQEGALTVRGLLLLGYLSFDN